VAEHARDRALLTRPVACLTHGRRPRRALRVTRRAAAASILGMAVYPSRNASTRLRVTDYFPHLEADGMRCRMWSFLSEADLGRWYGSSTVGRLLVVLRGVLRVPRAVVMLWRADVVIVQRECIPLGPPVLEWLASRRARMVWDVDDTVWRPYISPTAGAVTRWLRTGKRKHASICRRATEVWAGSSAIAEWAGGHNRRVVYVPTVVPVPAERPVTRRTASAAWVGTHATGPWLEAVLPHLARLDTLDGVVVVGASIADPPDGLAIEEVAWTSDNERQVCATARVGLYPIDRANPYAEGKCALKAILYMSCGLPTVCTPTGPNRTVVRDGVDGLHADTRDEWRAAVERLLVDDELWERCSREGHARAREQYSLEVWGPRIAERTAALARDEERREMSGT
jgi:hypothetical protein